MRTHHCQTATVERPSSICRLVQVNHKKGLKLNGWPLSRFPKIYRSLCSILRGRLAAVLYEHFTEGQTSGRDHPREASADLSILFYLAVENLHLVTLGEVRSEK